MLTRILNSGKIKPALFLCLMSLFCFMLSMTRILLTGTTEFLFLNWNLFLAFIPWFISLMLFFSNSLRGNSLMLTSLVLMWLIFFPNSPYILTDLFHLRDRGNAPVWFDLIIILSFGWTGLLFGFHSLKNIEELLKQKLNHILLKILTVIFFFITSFGVYLGRYQRWNSWDIIHNPMPILTDIISRFADPLAHPRTWGVTILLGILLNMIYWSVCNFHIKEKNNTGISPDTL